MIYSIWSYSFRYIVKSYFIYHYIVKRMLKSNSEDDVKWSSKKKKITKKDSQLIINSFSDSMRVMLVEDIKILSFLYKYIRTGYCNRLANKVTHATQKVPWCIIFMFFSYTLLIW